MAKEIMRRHASDNPYLHKDFHGALSEGIEYIHEHFGPEAVREYLRRFALEFYAPLTDQIKTRGLVALREHLERIYNVEGGEIDVKFTPDEMVVSVKSSPAVMHMKEHGYRVARMFDETIRTVNATICEGTPFAVEVLEYDEATGRSRQRFFRKMK